MAFKKVDRPAPATHMVGALLEVLPGSSEQDLVDWLHKEGVQEIKTLAPGFLSVVANEDTLRAAESKARVEIKRRKAPR